MKPLVPATKDPSKYAILAPKTDAPVITGDGAYSYGCANPECDAIVVKDFDHGQYRIESGVALKCGRCGALGEMPTGIPYYDPTKQTVIRRRSQG